MPIVLDCSVTLSLCFDDESSEYAAAAFAAGAADSIAVPALWHFEFRNGLIVGERRGRIDPQRTAAVLQRMLQLPIRIDHSPDDDALLSLARAHRLTVYDAAYLELAIRLRAPLATLDRALIDAAAPAGAILFHPPVS